MEGVDVRTIACRGHCTHLLPEVPMEYALCHGSHTCYWRSEIVNRGTCHWALSKPEQPRASREQIHSAADAGRPSPAPTISTYAFVSEPELSRQKWNIMVRVFILSFAIRPHNVTFARRKVPDGRACECYVAVLQNTKNQNLNGKNSLFPLVLNVE